MSKKQDEQLTNEFVYIKKSLSTLEDEWKYQKDQLLGVAQQYVDLIWHLFNFDREEETERNQQEVATLDLLLATNELELVDVGGLFRIRDLHHPSMDQNKEAKHYLNEIIMRDNPILKDDTPDEYLSNLIIFKNHKTLDHVLGDYGNWAAYLDSLREDDKNSILIELKMFQKILQKLDTDINREFYELNRLMLQDIARVQTSYNQLVKIC